MITVTASVAHLSPSRLLFLAAIPSVLSLLLGCSCMTQLLFCFSALPPLAPSSATRVASAVACCLSCGWWRVAVRLLPSALHLTGNPWWLYRHAGGHVGTTKKPNQKRQGQILEVTQRVGYNKDAHFLTVIRRCRMIRKDTTMNAE